MTFIPVPGRGGVLPLAREKAVASGGAWEDGGLLLVNASNEYAECAADPASIFAVALHAVGAGSGALYPVGRKEFPPNRAQGIWAGHEFGFIADYAGTLGTPNTAYGVVRSADTFWRVDFAETVNTRLTLTDIAQTVAPLSQRRVRVKFLTANVGVL